MSASRSARDPGHLPDFPLQPHADRLYRFARGALRRRAGALPVLRQTLPVAVIGVIGAPLAVFGWPLNVLPRRVTNGEDRPGWGAMGGRLPWGWVRGGHGRSGC